jgi:hypothetical protein
MSQAQGHSPQRVPQENQQGDQVPEQSSYLLLLNNRLPPDDETVNRQEMTY